MLFFAFTSHTASALSEEQKRLFQGGILYYDIEVCSNLGTVQNNSGRATGKVYMIGDSITQGTNNQLQTALTERGFTDVVIDGVVSRSLTPGNDTLNGIGVLERSSQQITGANTVIVALGANGGVTSDNIQRVMAADGPIKSVAPGAKIYWVNTGAVGGNVNAGAINVTLQDNAANGGYGIIDWASQVAAHPDYIANDGLGVHPSEAGRVPFANTVADGAISGGAAPQAPSGGTCACSLGSTVTLVGNDNAEKVYNFLVGKGLQPFQAAGIMGNMMAESSIEPMRLQGTAPGVETPADQVGDKVTGWGLVQWTPGSKFIQPTLAAGKDPNDLAVQLEFLWEQLEGGGPIPEKAAGDALKASTTIEEATSIFTLQYERPSVEGRKIELRTGFSRNFLAQFGSNTGGTATSGTSTCGGGGNGQVVGGFSLPTDRSFYDSNPEWFSKPHHDYPAADIPVPEGTPIYSMTAGKVLKAPVGAGCGTGVIIEAAPGIQFQYCHGSDGGSVDGAKEGDTVQPGQLIMHSSYTGNVDPPGPAGTHLHLAIEVDGTQFCPQGLFKSIADGSPIQDVSTLAKSGCTN